MRKYDFDLRIETLGPARSFQGSRCRSSGMRERSVGMKSFLRIDMSRCARANCICGSTCHDAQKQFALAHREVTIRKYNLLLRITMRKYNLHLRIVTSRKI